MTESENVPTKLVELSDRAEFVTATDALNAYNTGLISRDEARALFGLAPEEASDVG